MRSPAAAYWVGVAAGAVAGSFLYLVILGREPPRVTPPVNMAALGYTQHCIALEMREIQTPWFGNAWMPTDECLPQNLRWLCTRKSGCAVPNP